MQKESLGGESLMVLIHAFAVPIKAMLIDSITPSLAIWLSLHLQEDGQTTRYDQIHDGSRSSLPIT